MNANIALFLHIAVLLPIFLCFLVILFLSSPKEEESKRKVRKRPELGGRNTNSSNHSKNSLSSNSFSYFVAQIAFRNPRLNVDSKNLHSSKDLLVRNVFERSEETWSTMCGNRCTSEDKEIREKESNPKNIPHEEVFIGCTIIGIIFDSCIA